MEAGVRHSWNVGHICLLGNLKCSFVIDSLYHRRPQCTFNSLARIWRDIFYPGANRGKQSTVSLSPSPTNQYVASHALRSDPLRLQSLHPLYIFQQRSITKTARWIYRADRQSGYIGSLDVFSFLIVDCAIHKGFCEQCMHTNKVSVHLFLNNCTDKVEGNNLKLANICGVPGHLIFGSLINISGGSG